MKISHLCFSIQTTIGYLEKNILYLCSHSLRNAQMIETVWNLQHYWCAFINNKKFQEDLAKMGVMIRHYDKKELKGYIRISVGKPEHTDALMKGLNALQLWALAHLHQLWKHWST